MFVRAQRAQVRVNKFYRHLEHLSSSLGLCASLQARLRPWDQQGQRYFNDLSLECWIVSHSKTLSRLSLNQSAQWLVAGEATQLQLFKSGEDLRKYVDQLKKPIKGVVVRRVKDKLLSNRNSTFLLRSRLLITSLVPLRAYIHETGSLGFMGEKRMKPRSQEWTHGELEELIGSTAWSKVKLGVTSAVAKVLLACEQTFARSYARMQANFTCATCFQQLAVDSVITEDFSVRVIDIQSIPVQKTSTDKFDASLRLFETDSARLLFAAHRLDVESVSAALRSELNGVKYSDLRKGDYTAIIDIRLEKFFKWLNPSMLLYMTELHNEMRHLGRFSPIYPPLRGEQTEDGRLQWKLYLNYLGFNGARIKFHMLLIDLGDFFLKSELPKPKFLS